MALLLGSTAAFRAPLTPHRQPAVLRHRAVSPISCLALEDEAGEVVVVPPETPPTPLLALLDRTTKLQLGVLLLSGFLTQMCVGMIIVTLPAFAQTLGLGSLGVGLMVALPQLTKLLFNLPIGHFIDVNGRKPSLLVGGVLDALGQFSTAAATSLGALVPARLLVGVGSSTGGTAATAYLMDVVGKYPERSGLLLGAVQAIGFLAFAVGPAVGGVIGERGGPALPFVLLGAVLLLTTPLKALMPETLRKDDAEGTERGAAVPLREGLRGLRAAMRGTFASYARLLRDTNQLALLALKCSFLCGLSLILTVVPLHATAAWGATPADLGRLYSLMTFLSLVLSPLAGALADRVGRRPLAIGGALATALSVACMPLATSRLGYYAARSVWSAGEAFLITAYTALALDVTPEEQRGARASLDNQVGDVALLFLPILFGVLGQHSFAAAFWPASGLMLAAVATFARLSDGPEAAMR